MLLQRSKLAVATVERPRLASPWTIALLGTMVLALLVAIYPHRALVERVIDTPSSDLTEAYLLNLLRTDPDNPKLRLMLARNQLNAGLYERVQATLSPVLHSTDPHTRQQAMLLLWQSEEAYYRGLPQNSPQRAVALQSLHKRLADLAQESDDEQSLADIARKAMAFGDSRLGLDILKKLAARSTGHDTRWHIETAREALANSEYQSAAEFYTLASERAQTFEEQRRYFLLAMRTLQSGDRLADALDMAERQLARNPALADDSEILELLVHFARAAQRPDLADKYARRLLRLSLLEQMRREQLAANGFDAAPRRVAANDEDIHGKPGTGPQLPFDDRVYTLGYEAFLGNSKLEDAWKVAASAVRQAPDNLAWRERLAQVSEWTGRPQIALEQWRYLAKATQSEDAWQAILRLAPGLFDDEALRAGLQHQLDRQPNDAKVLRELLAIYERLGDPRGGMRLLEQTYQRTGQPWLLEQLAELAQRAGDDEQALSYWQRLIEKDGLTPTRAVRVATLLMLRGRQEEALALLERARATAAPGDTAFWRLTAALAQSIQKDSTAIDAYRHLIGQKNSEASDYEALSQLLQEEYPLEAAQIAAAGWKRFGAPRQLILALNLYAGKDRWNDVGKLIADLGPEQLKTLRGEPEFLQLSAQYYLRSGNLKQAWQDLEMALRLAPENTEIRSALLWLLIDSNDAPALRRLLAAQETAWQQDPTMHDALGSAYLALSLPDIALRRYYTPHLPEHREDFLWMMNYADALEQNQESDRAWQLREYFFTSEKQRLARQKATADMQSESGQEAVRQAARTRLLMAQRPGDPALGALREILRLDRKAGQEAPELSSSARDIALSWLQEQAQYSAARGWLWQRYANTASQPLWAKIAVAMAQKDRATAGQLLDRYGSSLSRYDRVGVASDAGDLRLAQSEGFNALEQQPADDPLHEQLTETLLAHSDHAGGELVRRDITSLVELDKSARWHLALSPRFALDLAAGTISRSDLDTSAVGVAPDETYRSARLTWRHADGETRLTAEDRDSFDRYTPVLLEHEQHIDDRLSFTLAAGVQQPANESTPLRVAGKKDRLAFGLRYQLDRNSRIGMDYAHEDFSTQTGDDVGKGKIWQLEAAHAIRLDPRDLEASVFWSNHRFSRRSADNVFDTRLSRLLPNGIASPQELGTDFFLPNNFRFYGVRLSTDTRFEQQYTRAWRPFATVARTWHSDFGTGYDVGAGIAGSVFGADHLSLGWRLSKGGSTTGDMDREIGLTYRIHY